MGALRTIGLTVSKSCQFLLNFKFAREGEKGREEQDPDQQTQPRVSVESSHTQL